jgi:hypothetical protein
MDNNKDDIRLDRTGERAANEPDLPTDNTTKPSDTPQTDEATGYADKKNMTQTSSATPEGSPDFGNNETAGNTNNDQ